MKVLHWYPNLLLSTGSDGVFQVVKRLSEAQSRLGFEVAVAAVRTPQRSQRIETRLLEWDASWSTRIGGAHLHWLPQAAISDLRGFAPDVVHAHGDFNFDNWWLPLVFDCPIVFSPHGAFHPEVFTKGRKASKRTFLALAKPLFYRKTDLFHACCPLEGHQISQLLPGARVYCLPHGSSRDIAPRTARGSRPEITFAFLGRLDVFTKGLDILLEAFALVAKRLQSGCRLSLIGPDQAGGRSLLEKKAQELGVGELVRFHGSLSGMELDTELFRADIYVQLSRHEGFSLSAVEALLSGLPTILSAPMGTVSQPEIQALPHVRVVHPNPEEAAMAMLDFALRLHEVKAMAERFQPQLAALFSWERIAQSHLAQYQELVAKTTSR